MPKLNIPGSGHAGPAAVAGWQWLPVPTATHRARLQTTVNIINTRVKGYAQCNAAFRKLPGGRTFTQVWTDPAVWLSYDPGSAAGRFGATLGNEVTLSQYAFRMGHWTLVATIIHELAHVDGADGVSHDAEATLQQCLMGAHHDAAIIGQILAAPRPSMLAGGPSESGSTTTYT